MMFVGDHSEIELDVGVVGNDIDLPPAVKPTDVKRRPARSRDLRPASDFLLKSRAETRGWKDCIDTGLGQGSVRFLTGKRDFDP